MGHVTIGSWLYTLVVLALVAPAGGADEATDLYDAASGFFNRDYFDLAAAEYEKFLKAYPNHELAAPARFFLAESYFQLKKIDTARTGFTHYLAKHPTGPHSPQAQYRAGETSYLLSDWKNAETWLSQFIAKRPSDKLLEYALPYLAEAQLNSGKLPEAKASYQRGLQAFPKGRLADRARYGYAQTLDRLGESDAAAPLYRELAANPASEFADDALLALGANLFAAKSYDAAIQAYDAFETQFATSPLRPTAQLNRALCLYQLQRWDLADAAFRALGAGPSPVAADASYWLGMTLIARKQFDVAAQTLHAAHERFRGSALAPEMLFHSADALMQLGQFGPAEQRFLEVVKLYAKHELADDAVYSAAQCSCAAAQYGRVLTLTDGFGKLFPQSNLSPRVWLIRGQALFALDRRDESIAQLRSLLGARPEPEVERPARYQLAAALHKSGKLDDALSELAPVLAAPTADAVAADACYLAATCHYEKKDHAAAIPLFTRHIELQPQGELVPAAWSYIAIGQAALGQFDQMRPAVTALLKTYPKAASTPTALLRVAELCYGAKRHDLASELYAELAQRGGADPLHAQAVSGLGWCSFQQKKYGAAAATFAQLLAAHPADPLAAEAAYVRGRALEADNKTADAITAYALVTAQYGSSPFAFDAALQRARVLQKMQDTPQAIAAYADLAQRFPQSKSLDVVLNEWAWVHLLAKQEPEAAKLFDQLLTRFPDSPLVADATLNAAELLYSQKQYDAVLARLTPLLAKPLPAKVREPMLFRIGRTQVERQAWDATRAAFDALAKEFPKSQFRREAAFWLAEADHQSRRPREVVVRLASLLAEPAAAEPWLPTAWLRLAQAQGELKQWKESVLTCEELIKRFPAYDLVNLAHYHRGRALQTLARFDEAREAYRRAIAVRPDETAARSQLMMGESYFHQRRYGEAVREFLKVEILYDFPEWQAAGLLEAGKCHELLEDWGRAVEAYNRILQRFPKSSSAAEAAQRVQVAQKKAPARASSNGRGEP
jgi:TolA-binding protein